MKLYNSSRKSQNNNNGNGEKNKDVDDKQNRILSDSLPENIKLLRDIFYFPTNEDFIMREVYIESMHRYGVIMYMNGMVDETILQEFVLEPLLHGKHDIVKITEEKRIECLMESIIDAKNLKKLCEVKNIVNDIVQGLTVLLLDGFSDAVSISTVGLQHKSIDKPQNENVIKGPNEAFVESAEINRGLVRKYIKNPELVTENMYVGEREISRISIMYIKGIVDPKLIEEVKKRISDIKADSITTLAILEQYIEERPYSLIPTVLHTERPDRCAAFLTEGHVVMLMDSAPSGLVVPALFWSFFHTSEDQYERWAYGNFIRFIRILAMLSAMLVPALYTAVANYHVEMIPTDLLLSIAATRERIPFPLIVEILLMEIAFELIREAGIRVPTPIGPTIGIVGALILGQAAVDADVVSPILVIIVSLTGLASFAIPEVSLSYMIRISRFIFFASAATLGFYGLSAMLMIGAAYILSIKSFGVPFFSPLAPYYPSSRDLFLRSPILKQWIRPLNLNPQDKQRAKKPVSGQEDKGK